VSTDLVNWQDVGLTGIGGLPPLVDVIHDGSRFLAAAESGPLATSSDGDDWQVSDESCSCELMSIASNQTVIVAVGYGEIRYKQNFDAIWSLARYSPYSQLNDVAWGGSVFVAVGQDGLIWTSADAADWENQDAPLRGALHHVEWIDDRFLVVGESGVVMESPDGIQWTRHQDSFDQDLSTFTATDDGILAFGSGGLMQRLRCGDQSVSAEFAFRPGHGVAGEPIRFIDLSSGEATSWLWDFGDGQTATEASPVHVFSSPGNFLVQLRVADQESSDEVVYPVVINSPCGYPLLVPEVQAPAEAPSEQGFIVSWNDVGSDAYELVYSETADFSESSTRDVGPNTRIEFRENWVDSRSLFFRVRALNQCFDGKYRGGYSDPVEVRINPVISSPGAHEYVVPLPPSGLGRGADRIIDVMIYNPNEDVATAALFLLEAGSDENGIEVSIPAGESLVVADVFNQLSAGLGSPGVLVGSDQPILVSSRSVALTGQGSHGCVVQGMTSRDGLQKNEERLPIPFFDSDQVRTRLMISNSGSSLGEIRIEVATPGEPYAIGVDLDVGPFQTFLFDGISGEDLHETTVSVTTIQQYPSVFAAAAMVDARTGDQIVRPVAALKRDFGLAFDNALTIVPDAPWEEVTYADGVYVAVGDQVLAWSDDGRSWQLVEIGDHSLYDVQHNGEQFMAVGCSVVYFSDDGKQWSEHGISSVPCVYAVAWDGQAWFGIVNNGRLARSADGTNWDEIESLAGSGIEAFYSVSAGGGLVIAGRNGGIAVSQDGSNWQVVPIEGIGRVVDVEWNGSLYVGVGNTVITSENGVDWQLAADSSLPATEVVWTGSQWIVVGHVIATSTDGFSWTRHHELEWRFYAVDMVWDGRLLFGLSMNGYIAWIVPNSENLMIPVVAHSEGLNDTSWLSDLGLFNSGDDELECSIDLLASKRPKDTVQTVAASVPPRQWLQVDDPLSELFSEDGIAALRLRPAQPGLAAQSRTFFDTGDGLYQQNIPALAGEDRVWFFNQGWLLQLAQYNEDHEGYRSNLGLISDCDRPMQVDVDLYRAPGQWMGRVSRNLDPFELKQINRVFRKVTAEDVVHGYARVSTPTQGCAFYAYGSVIDNQSNDPMTVTVMKREPIQ